MKALDLDDLAAVTGGNSIFTDPNYCTPDNQTGARIYHQSVRTAPPAQAPIGQRLEEMWQHSMGPWETFNGLFRGAGARAPHPPTNLRPLGSTPLYQ